MNPTRFSRRPFPGVLAVLTLSATVCFIRLAPAQTPQSPSTQIGVVDEDKLADGFKKYANAVAAIDKRAQDLDLKIQGREFLSADEGKNFDTLILRPTPSASESTQLDTIAKTGIARRQEYLGLVGKAVRADAESNRMQVLQSYSTQNQPQLRQLSDQLLQLVRTQQDTTDKQYTDQANGVVAQVAQDRKLAMIIRKKALIYSSDAVDVTSEVLNRLNK